MSEQVRRVAVWAAAGLLTAALVVTSRSSAAVPTVAASRDLAAHNWVWHLVTASKPPR